MDRRQVSEVYGTLVTLEGMCGGLHLDLPLPLFFPWVLADYQATIGVNPYCPFLLTLDP